MRVDLAAHDPRVLANLPSPREPELLEQLGGRAEEEPALSLPSVGRLGDRLDETAAGSSDLGERAVQPGPCDSAAAMLLVDEDAGDPPARRRRGVLRVLAVVLEPELLRTAVLAPALREVILVEDQRRMGAAGPDELLLQRAGIADAALVLGVKGDAPAPSVDPVVALDQLRKGVPRGRVERAGLVLGTLGRGCLSLLPPAVTGPPEAPRARTGCPQDRPPIRSARTPTPPTRRSPRLRPSATGPASRRDRRRGSSP